MDKMDKSFKSMELKSNKARRPIVAHNTKTTCTIDQLPKLGQETSKYQQKGQQIIN